MCGGFIPDPEGNVDNNFEWCLGRVSNNQLRALALCQGFRIINERECKKIIVIGDPTLVIKLMLKVSSSSNGSLVMTITRIKQEISRFESIEFYHVLRALKWQVASMANKATNLSRGILRLKDRKMYDPIL
jgi:ribonuclease HI